MKRSLNFLSSYLSLRACRRLALFIIAAALLLPGSLQAQTLKKVPFPFSPIGLNCLPWFVVKEARLSEKYGIELDPIFIGASSALFQSMLSGAAEMSGSGGPAIIANILSGGDIIHVTAMVPRFTQSVMVKAEIKKPEDMAGKKIGVSRLGTGTHFSLPTALDGYGGEKFSLFSIGGPAATTPGLGCGLGERGG